MRGSWLAAAALALLAGCASPDPNLYALAAVDGAAAPGGPRAALLRDVSVAKYLDREHIVRSSEDYRVEVQGNDWWSEPLPGMIGRVLSAELSQRLPGTGVFAEAGAISPGSDSVVSVNVLRLDADPSGSVVLEAQVAVSLPPGTREVRFVVPPAGPDLRSEVAAMSTAVGRLADVIADMLRG
jgi:uncharacterized lipoprotein YmbA